jgi:SSS family solute:Na+ symporter
MNTTLIVFVVLYLLGTLALGVWAGTRIKNTSRISRSPAAACR